MGDNRQATRAPGLAPDAKKKDAGAEPADTGAVPEGAAEAPGSALIALGAAHASSLLGMLQSAGGNAEVNELQSLETGRQLAAQAKADKENIDTMTDGQKVEKFGGQGEGSGKAPAPEGTPPEGAAAPAAVQGFHSARSGQLSQLAAQHASVGGQLAGAGAAEGLAPQMAGFLGQAGAQSLAQGASLGQLAQAYIATSQELGKSEFVGAAMPSGTVQADYVARAAGIQSQVAAIDAMTAEYGAALQAEQAKIAGIDSQITAIQQQIAEAQAQKGEQPAPAAEAAPAAPIQKQAAEAKAPEAKAPAPAPAPSGASKKSAPAAPSGASKKSAPATKAPSAAPAAAAKAEAPSVAPAATAKAEAPAAPAPTSDPAAALTAQIQTLQQQKVAIEKAIQSNQGLVSTMQAYRDQMNALYSAYQTVLGIAPPQG